MLEPSPRIFAKSSRVHNQRLGCTCTWLTRMTAVSFRDVKFALAAKVRNPPLLAENHATTLSSNRLFAILLSQHRFHVV